jgi:hypothetical protein
MPREINNVQLSNFSFATPFITPTLFANVFDELLWS